jgi:hypothetical protein
MSKKRLCINCMFYTVPTTVADKKYGMGMCRLFPQHVRVKGEKHWCGHIRYRSSKSYKVKKNDKRVEYLADYYRTCMKELYGYRGVVYKSDRGLLRKLATNRTDDECEWIIRSFLESPPRDAHGKRGISAIWRVVVQGQLVNRDHVGTPLDEYLDSQSESCDDDKLWDEYEVYVLETEERIPYLTWKTWEKK